jgi:MFS family permease
MTLITDIITDNYVITIIITAIMYWIYIKKSPTWADKVRLTIALVLIPIIAATIWLTMELWNHTASTDPDTIYQIGIIPLFVVIYLLTSTFFVLLTSWKKKGYRNLKKFSERGLILGLVFGLLGGLITGLIAGLILGLMYGFIAGLISRFVGGLTFWLIGGLIFGLIHELEFFQQPTKSQKLFTPKTH